MTYIDWAPAASFFPSPDRRRQAMEEIMRDEIFDRDYQAGRPALNDGIDRLVRTVGEALRALHAIQFDAPWKRSATDKVGKSA